MKKNDDRKQAEQIFLKERGRITNKELAKKLFVHPATVARWRKLDEWDLKLHQEATSRPAPEQEEEDFYATGLRHLKALNERIDLYLQKKELLPVEILQLAEAKLHIISCMEIMNDNFRFHPFDDYELEEEPPD